jgi:hypothetical protein
LLQGKSALFILKTRKNGPVSFKRKEGGAVFPKYQPYEKILRSEASDQTLL